MDCRNGKGCIAFLMRAWNIDVVASEWLRNEFEWRLSFVGTLFDNFVGSECLCATNYRFVWQDDARFFFGDGFDGVT